ncbi:MAG: hypothetical protein K5769_02700 [Pseudobutyrivibrio sp.]|nr:hypothetical protein [Pseudobutyrivibrio sp.]
MGITEIIAKYIYENNISLKQISIDTDIDIKKLDLESNQILTGQEMLTVCSYLRIRPEELVEKYHDYL